MHQVLYRKCRPKTFAEVIGQDAITTTLQNQIKTARVAHAYLFTGSRGTGKTTCAKIMAKAVNCLSPADGNPCLACENCRGIENDSILDVVEIDAASNNGVDNIRELREQAGFAPAAAKYRVYIIDEVHMLSTGAFNALLKTLEEPPAHVLFILATTDVNKLPLTVLSRCQRFDFKRIPAEVIARGLLDIAGSNGFELEPPAALLIARMADGGMRDALSILEKCTGLSGRITEDLVARASGAAGREYLSQLCGAVYRQDAGGALQIIDKLHNDSKDMGGLCDELISHFRGLMIVKTAKAPRGFFACADSEYAEIAEQAGQFTLERILHIIDMLAKSRERFSKGNSGRIELEAVMLRLCVPGQEASVTALLARVAELERLVGAGSTRLQDIVQPAEDAVPPQNPPCRCDDIPPLTRGAEISPVGDDALIVPQNAEEAVAPSPKSDFNWGEVLAALNKTSPLLYRMLIGSSAHAEGETLTIRTASATFAGMLRQEQHYKAVVGAAKAITGREYRIKTEKPGDSGGIAGTAEDLMNNIRQSGIDVKIS